MFRVTRFQMASSTRQVSNSTHTLRYRETDSSISVVVSEMDLVRVEKGIQGSFIYMMVRRQGSWSHGCRWCT